MRITYDKKADAMALILADDPVAETRNIAPGVEADFDANGRLLAIELLGASKKYDAGGSWLSFHHAGCGRRQR